MVLGATGSVGQRFVQLLDGHPWFEVVALTGSERSAGQPYASACRWVLDAPMPEYAKAMILQPSTPAAAGGARLAFSALPSDQAGAQEPAFARAGLAVCSNASAFRQEADVPLLLPEVNPEHVRLVPVQRRQRGWPGCIVTNPNCTSTGLTVALKALQDAFGLRRAFVVSLQALSGAGYPGVPSLDVIDNVIPYIGGEEEKVEQEPRKMLGQLSGEKILPASLSLSAHTNRVAVSDGHLVVASVELERYASPDEAAAVLQGYTAPPTTVVIPAPTRCST